MQEVVHCRPNIKYSTKKLWYIAAMVRYLWNCKSWHFGTYCCSFCITSPSFCNILLYIFMPPPMYWPEALRFRSVRACVLLFVHVCDSQTNIVSKISWAFVDRIWPNFYLWQTSWQGWTHQILGSKGQGSRSWWRQIGWRRYNSWRSRKNHLIVFGTLCYIFQAEHNWYRRVPYFYARKQELL